MTIVLVGWMEFFQVVCRGGLARGLQGDLASELDEDLARALDGGLASVSKWSSFLMVYSGYFASGPQ